MPRSPRKSPGPPAPLPIVDVESLVLETRRVAFDGNELVLLNVSGQEIERFVRADR